MTRRITITVLALAVSSLAFAQSDTPAPAKMDCKAMMQQMQAQMKTMDDRLQSLVKQMNQAQGAARTEAMIAVLNELVAQHQQMRGHMTSMMQMEGAGMHATHDMKDCPMIQSKEKAAAAHR